jgi:hypothetical protein
MTHGPIVKTILLTGAAGVRTRIVSEAPAAFGSHGCRFRGAVVVGPQTADLRLSVEVPSEQTDLAPIVHELLRPFGDSVAVS